jgi:hypothetical protein
MNFNPSLRGHRPQQSMASCFEEKYVTPAWIATPLRASR